MLCLLMSLRGLPIFGSAALHTGPMQLEVTLRPIALDHPVPHTPSEFEEWGERDPQAEPIGLERWLVEVNGDVVGMVSAHPVWYGPNRGSMAMNIGIGLLVSHRGRGIGSVAQRQLADLLHARGVHRVEASTDVDNVAEQRALQKARFTLEGVAVGAQVRADGRHDLQVWSHVPSDHLGEES